MPKKGATKSSKVTSRNYGETQIERLDYSSRPSNRNIPGNAEQQVCKIHTYSKAGNYTDNNTERVIATKEVYSGEHWVVELPTPCEAICQTPNNWDSPVTTHRIYDFDLSIFLHPPICHGSQGSGIPLVADGSRFVVTAGKAEDSQDLLRGSKNVMFVVCKTNPQAKYEKSKNQFSDTLAISNYLSILDGSDAVDTPADTHTITFLTKTDFERVCFAFNPLYACFYEYIPHGIPSIGGTTTQTLDQEGHFRIHEYRRNDDSTNDYAVDRLSDSYVVSMFVPQGYSMAGDYKKLFPPWKKAEITLQCWYKTVAVKASTLYLQNVDMFQLKDLDDSYTARMGDKICSDGWVNQGTVKGANEINVIPVEGNRIGMNVGVGTTYDKTVSWNLPSSGPWP